MGFYWGIWIIIKTKLAAIFFRSFFFLILGLRLTSTIITMCTSCDVRLLLQRIWRGWSYAGSIFFNSAAFNENNSRILLKVTLGNLSWRSISSKNCSASHVRVLCSSDRPILFILVRKSCLALWSKSKNNGFFVTDALLIIFAFHTQVIKLG